MSARPPVTLDLTWEGELRFAGRAGQAEVVLDGAAVAGPSPTQALAFGLAGCMAIDVVHILTRGRHPLRGLRARLVGTRRDEEPRRFVTIDLHFEVTGDVPPAAVERAIALSRETYCSVWHSLRQDIAFTTAFEVVKGAA
jgi:putative redox protein